MLACNAKQKNNPSATSESAKPVDAAHLITMDGIGDIKEGISQTDLEAMLKRKIHLQILLILYLAPGWIMQPCLIKTIRFTLHS
jgi:hypothetical protein